MCRDFCFNLSPLKNKQMASKEILSTGPTVMWNTLEKIMAIIIAAACLFILYSEVAVVAGIIRSGYMSSGKQTYLQLIQAHHLPVILGIAGLFGGSMMLFNDKTGWILSLITTIMFGVLFFVSSRSNALNGSLAFASFYKSYGITSIIWFVFFLLLLLKPFRRKYHPTAKNWLWITAVVLVLILDKLLI